MEIAVQPIVILKNVGKRLIEAIEKLGFMSAIHSFPLRNIGLISFTINPPVFSRNNMIVRGKI